MSRTSLDGALRVVAIVTMVLLGALSMAIPSSVLVGGLAWLVFLVCIASGWGYLVALSIGAEDPGLGLRSVWGFAGYLAVAGVLVAFGGCSRPMILFLIGVGAIGFAWREVTTPTATWHHIRAAGHYARVHPGVALLVGVIAGVALVRIAGAVAALDRSPWDDDMAYTPFVDRLLETGDLVEPYSLRRLGAWGGQTALQALGAARGTLANVHLIDQALCMGLTLVVVVEYARERMASALWLALLALVIVLLPPTALNTASYWSGALFLFGLFRTVGREQWTLVGLVAAATCTLRQSYLPVVVIFVGVVLILRLRDGGWRRAWPTERGIWARVVGVAFVSLIGWWIAAFIASRTFLFPLIDGTFNHALSLKPTALTWPEELQFFLWCCIETSPLVVVPPLFAVLLVSRDRRPTRPLTALFVAALVGFVILVHSFAGSEAPHLWRYAFGPALALLAALVIEVGATEDSPGVEVPALGRWIVLGALVIQLVATRGALPAAFRRIANDVREARAYDKHGDPTERAARQRHAALQSVIPPKARVAVALDDAAYLDFGRNDIMNLDIPGYASPGAQLPTFEGAEAWRAYFLDRGIRYVAFVRAESSRYVFRRGFWLWRIFNDGELNQIMSAYMIDAIDTFATLATKAKVLYDAEGLVALDLGEAPQPVPRSSVDERERRDRFVRALVVREGLQDAWSLSSRANVLIEDGFSALAMIDDAEADDPVWFEIVHRLAPPATPDPKRGTPVRWLYRRAHARVHGETAMRLVLRGKVNLATLYTRPRLDVSLDGELIASAIVDDTGVFVVDVVVPADRVQGWSDLYLVWSTVSEPEHDARDLRVARLLRFEWEPAP